MWDGRSWECGVCVCVCVIRGMQAVELSGPHAKIISRARTYTHTQTHYHRKRARVSDYLNAVPTEVIWYSVCVLILVNTTATCVFKKVVFGVCTPQHRPTAYHYISVLILLCMCPHTTYTCPHTTIYVSTCVLILLYICPHTTICVLILL